MKCSKKIMSQGSYILISIYPEVVSATLRLVWSFFAEQILSLHFNLLRESKLCLKECTFFKSNSFSNTKHFIRIIDSLLKSCRQDIILYVPNILSLLVSLSQDFRLSINEISAVVPHDSLREQVRISFSKTLSRKSSYFLFC